MLSAPRQHWLSWYNMTAERLDASNEQHLRRVAEVIKAGGIVAFPFNGIFGLFGDADNEEAAEKIINAKNRPKDKKLILVPDLGHIEELVDLRKVNFPVDRILSLWRSIHALGLILPAATTAPGHLVIKDEIDTVLPIWTEYKPLITMMGHFRKLGHRALVGTSANKSGMPTHYEFEPLWQDFSHDVDAVVEANFDHLPPTRLKSTTVVDLTNSHPRLHRLGNVDEEELREALAKNGFPELVVLRDIIQVRGG